VFTFLIILVVALNLMSRIAFYFDTAEEAPTTTTGAQQPAGKPENTALIAVISAAISRYRSTRS
jgi:oxaloacetate decarboxylase gamma subunit